MLIILDIEYESNLGMRIPMICLFNCLSALQLMIKKYLLEKKYFTVCGLLLSQGLIGLAGTFSLGLVLHYFPGQAFGTAEMFDQTGKCFKEIILVFLFIGMIFTNNLNALFIAIIKYHYTSIHCFVSNFFGSMADWIELIATDSTITELKSILTIGVAYIIVLIGFLIYTAFLI